MPYAMEFRIAVANAYDECGSSIEVAEQFGCSESWVRDLIARRRATGSLAPLPPRRPDMRKLDEQDLVRLRELIRDKPDMTPAELAHAMGNKASVPTVWRATQRLDLPLKKRPGTPASRTGPTSSSGVTTGSSSSPAWRSPGSFHRRVRRDDQHGPGLRPRPARRARRCKTPHGHWKVLSTIAAMTVHGMLGYGTFDGATDTDTFVAFGRDGLAPHLVPGQVVVLDNLPAHKSPKVDALIEAAGARLLRLPPYSPDFNQIEMAISKVKSILRAAGARTVGSLLDTIGRALSRVTATDAINFIRECGYADRVQ